jgi:hypothetical protein
MLGILGGLRVAGLFSGSATTAANQNYVSDQATTTYWDNLLLPEIIPE